MRNPVPSSACDLPESITSGRNGALGANTSPHSTHVRSPGERCGTPQELFHCIHREFGFTVDVRATPAHGMFFDWFTPEQQALELPWQGICWMNPPGGRQVGAWVKKAYESSLRGATVVALLPARTDTQWWHDYVVKASEVRFLRGRLRFNSAPHGAAIPSALVIFRPPAVPLPGDGQSSTSPDQLLLFEFLDSTDCRGGSHAR